jgi:MraZ protein
MFRGTHQTKVDEKGRIKVPADFKRLVDELYGPKFFITSRDGQRAEIYPMKEWERIEDELANAPSSGAKSRLMDATNYFGQVVEMDAQGRLLIPQILREKGKLKGDVAVIGKHQRLDLVNNEGMLARLEADPVTSADLDVVRIKGL